MPTPRLMRSTSIPKAPRASRAFRPGATLPWLLCLICLLAFTGIATGPLSAQPAPDPFLQGFQEIGTYALSVDGQKAPGAQIYKSDRARAFLLLGSGVDRPILIDMRSRQVETVGIMSLAKRQDGTIDILADASVTPQGPFQIDGSGTGVSFATGGHKYALSERASLVGPQKASDLTAYDPSYARRAEAYTPNPSLVAQLDKESQPVRVQVFFNSKCPHCELMVPRIIKVQETLDNPKITFDYYGVPDSFKDPVMDAKDVHGTPTGIVYVKGKEVGRIVGEQWNVPELAIQNVLTGGKATG